MKTKTRESVIRIVNKRLQNRVIEDLEVETYGSIGYTGDDDGFSLCFSDEFPNQCGAITIGDFELYNLNDEIILEEIFKNFRSFVNTNEYNKVIFCSTVSGDRADKVFKKLITYSEAKTFLFLTQRNPNTKHIINYYYKII